MIRFGRQSEGVKKGLGAYVSGGVRSSYRISLRGRIGGMIDRGVISWIILHR